MKSCQTTCILTLLVQLLLASEPILISNSQNMLDPITLQPATTVGFNFRQSNAEIDSIIEPVDLMSGFNPQWNAIVLENNGITCITTDGKDLYVGGYFHNAGGNPDADFIARWDGCQWHALGTGLNGAPKTLGIHGSDLYVGGIFTSAGGVSNTSYIARWDGSTWQNVGQGLNATVSSIGFSPEGIIVGGGFTDAGGNENADLIAMWTGVEWKDFGTAINGPILDIEVKDQDIYICGYFYNAGGNPHADYIARWDGTSWQNLGTETDNFRFAVKDIALHGDDLYAGGHFSISGLNEDIYKIARFDGSTWHKIGSYFSAPYRGNVTALCIVDDYLYTGIEKNSFDALILRCDLTTEEWIEYSSYYPGNQTIEELSWNGSDLYICGNNGYGPGYGGEGIWRWGIPSSGITIQGVPGVVCKKDLPVSLPIVQDGYTGTWTGPGVTNNVFNPIYSGSYDLMFKPEQIACAEGILFRIRVSRDSIFHNILPRICETDRPIDLSRYPHAITGEWSGDGVSDNYFDPSGLSGNILLSFSPDPGQCVQDTSITIVVNELHIPEITGVPNIVCETDLPICVNDIQDSIWGYWIGPGLSWYDGNYHFNPSGLSGNVLISFYPYYPEAGSCGVGESYPYCIGSASINIEVIDSSHCSCTTHSGSIGYTGSTLNICIGPKFSVSHNGDDYLEPDDVINFVLHNNPGNQLGKLYGVSLDGVFSCPPDIFPGTTYYISAVAGGSNYCSGYVNLMDPCLSVSSGVPVIFHACDPEAQNITQIPFEDASYDRTGNHELRFDQVSTTKPDSNITSDDLFIPNLFTNNENSTNTRQRSFWREDPDVIIKRIQIYDFLGRLNLSRTNLTAYEMDVIWSSIKKDIQLPPGVFAWVAEIEKGNGEIQFIRGRIIGVE